MQEFLKVFCENDDFLAQRRKVLRLRAGLRDEDRRLVFVSAGHNDVSLWNAFLWKRRMLVVLFSPFWFLMHTFTLEVPKFRFLILEGRQTTEREVLLCFYLQLSSCNLPSLSWSLIYKNTYYIRSSWGGIRPQLWAASSVHGIFCPWPASSQIAGSGGLCVSLQILFLVYFTT